MPDASSADPRLDDYVFQRGPVAGRLALALDDVTDALIILSAHRVYAHPATGLPRRDGDIAASIATLERVRVLLRDALHPPAT